HSLGESSAFFCGLFPGPEPALSRGRAACRVREARGTPRVEPGACVSGWGQRGAGGGAALVHDRWPFLAAEPVGQGPTECAAVSLLRAASATTGDPLNASGRSHFRSS